MRINIKVQNHNPEAGEPLLNARQILRYFVKGDDQIENIILSGGRKQLTTTDHAIYEALGSIDTKDKFNWRTLVKFLENIKVISYENVHRRPKPILTEQRVVQLRKNLSEVNKNVRQKTK